MFMNINVVHINGD